MAQTRTLTALDPVTGARVTRRTARTYVAAVVWTAVDGSVHVHAWAGRPDLAAKQLAKLERLGIAGTPRLAPVVEDPWAEAPAEPVAEPVAAPVPEPVAAPVPATRAERALTVCQAALAAQELTRTLPRTRPTLPGEALPPEPPAWPAPEPTLPSLAALSRTLGRELGLPQGGRLPSRRPAAGEPWDPGTPEARERVALQGERVATLWPIAQAVRGAGLILPGAWATDGPVMAGTWPVAQALDCLPSDCLQAAAVALATLPPVTVAQERALAACRAARARAVV